MNGSGVREQVQYAWRATIKHRAWWAIGIMLILAGLIWRPGWVAAGALAQFLVALIALGGYAFSYQMNRQEQARKYRVALVATLELLPIPSPRENGPIPRGSIPGFQLWMRDGREVLESRFDLANISESPVTDVRMNFYLHGWRVAQSVEKFLERDVELADGMAKASAVHVERRLSSDRIRQAGDVTGDESGNARGRWQWNYFSLFYPPIPSEHLNRPARLWPWSLVIKYKNLAGEPFFTVYKLEGPEHADELMRMAFHGSFAGDYRIDDKEHQFVENRGFKNRETAPDWEGVMAVEAEALRSRNVLLSETRNGIGQTSERGVP